MMDYNNPNDPWMNTGYDPFKGMSEDERMKAGCLQAVDFILMIVLGLALCALLGSCTTTQYVPVVQTHEQHHWHTDSVKEKDSTYHEKETIIQELDSAAMAKYGIRLKSAERAWLVRTAELQRQIERLEAMSAVRDSVHDSIPVPYPVIKEVPADLPWYERGLMAIGGFFIMLLMVLAFAFVLRHKLPI